MQPAGRIKIDESAYMAPIEREVKSDAKEFPCVRTIGLVNPKNEYKLIDLFRNAKSPMLFGIMPEGSKKIALCYSGTPDAGKPEVTFVHSINGNVRHLMLGDGVDSELMIEEVEGAFSCVEHEPIAFTSKFDDELNKVVEGSVTVMNSSAHTFKIKSKTPFKIHEMVITEKGLVPGKVLEENKPEQEVVDNRPIWLGKGPPPYGTKASRFS